MTSAPDPDNQAWRIVFVRLLLCVLLLYDFATIVMIEFVRPRHATMRELSPIIALIICFAFAAIALTRLRGEAIVALATGALLSIWSLVQALSYTPVLTAVFRRASNWRVGVAMLIVLAIGSLPTVAFFVMWPLRPPLRNAYTDSAEESKDHRAPPADAHSE